MKPTIKLIALLLVLVAGYALYSLVTFQPDQEYEFTFKEPTLPPDIQANIDAENQADKGLTPQQITQRNQALSMVQQAIDQYQMLEQSLPPQASSTMAILNGYFLSGQLPAYFLGMSDSTKGIRQYGPLAVSSLNTVVADSSRKNIGCTSDSTGSETLIGNEFDNNIECDNMNKAIGHGDRFILGGPGNDKITDTYGNRIINGGTGNDIITAGPGRTILILEDGWGQDTLNIDCGDAAVTPTQVPSEFPTPWLYKFNNFIVLSPRVDPNDVEWVGNVLKSKSGTDTLTVNQSCFTVVPAAETPATAAAVPQ